MARSETIEVYRAGVLINSYTVEVPTEPLLDRLSAVFDSIPREGVPVAVRAYFRSLQSTVRECLLALPQDVEAAQYWIESATLPDGSPLPQEFDAFRQALLTEFEE